MSKKNSPKLRELISRVTLVTLAYRYAAAVWEGWKAGMTKKLNDSSLPFKGAPVFGMRVVAPDGTTSVLNQKSRLRINEVDDATLQGLDLRAVAAICRAAGKTKEDIFHPQYVETFEELVALDRSYLDDNLGAAANVIAWVADDLAIADTTVDSFVSFGKQLLAGKQRKAATALNSALRKGWLMNKVLRHEEKTHKDFCPNYELDVPTSELDTYVVVPVLEAFIHDLKSGAFDAA